MICFGRSVDTEALDTKGRKPSRLRPSLFVPGASADRPYQSFCYFWRDTILRTEFRKAISKSTVHASSQQSAA